MNIFSDSQERELHEIYKYVTNFINDYNSIKIDGYVSKKSDASKLLLFREKIYKLCKIASSVSMISIDEFDKIKCVPSNEEFFITKVNTDLIIKLFILYSVFYYLDSIHSPNKLFIGLDFEFNQRKIALCQISFYPYRPMA